MQQTQRMQHAQPLQPQPLQPLHVQRMPVQPMQHVQTQPRQLTAESVEQLNEMTRTNAQVSQAMYRNHTRIDQIAGCIQQLVAQRPPHYHRELRALQAEVAQRIRANDVYLRQVKKSMEELHNI